MKKRYATNTTLVVVFSSLVFQDPYLISATLMSSQRKKQVMSVD